MGNWLHDLGLFFVDVLAHWQALLTGGIVIAAVGLYERKKKQLSWESYIFIALVFGLYSVFAAWQDEHRNTSRVITEKAVEASLKDSCIQDARVEHAYMVGLQELNGSQRQTIDKQQQANDSQQRDISSCVVSLGKMNPRIREEILVITIPYATVDSAGKFVSKLALVKTYLSLLLITTNELEPRFHGSLRCDNPFTPTSAPQLPSTSQTVFKATATPTPISPNEYEISVTVGGTDWAPAHPVYMTISTSEPNPGKCKFTPME